MFKFLVPELRAWLLGFFFMVWLLPTVANVPPLEARRDQLMEKRFRDALAALREHDDAQTLKLLKTMEQEFTAEMLKLKPAYQAWYRSLTAEEKRKLLHQASIKQWMLLMQEIQFDACIQRRFRENPALKREYESIQFVCDTAAALEP